MSTKKNDPGFNAAYDRAMLRSEFLSLFWNVFSARKSKDHLTLAQLAAQIGSSKHEVSRWFNGDPNWTINTISSIAGALGVKLRIEAIDAEGRIYSASDERQSIKQLQTITSSSQTEQKIKITRNLTAGTSHIMARAR